MSSETQGGFAAGKVDQFESAFRAAAKETLRFTRPDIARVLVASDLERAGADAYGARVRGLMRVLEQADHPVTWDVLARDDFTSGQQLLDRIERDRVDLVCSYRHLREHADWPHGLGTYLDVLTQAAPCPVLVTPHPDSNGVLPHAMQNTDVVMAMTDHLAGDHRLVSWAATCTTPTGCLWLAHVEDQAVYDRYVAAISRIPSIETDPAAQAIRERLLEDPRDFIESCRAVLQRDRPRLSVQGEVTMGHRLAEYRRLIEQHEVDLLVFHTKDDDQLAMHGLAYPLAVELRRIPLLML